MNLDLDLIRQILLQMEKLIRNDQTHWISIEGHDAREIGEHCEWIYSEGLFEAQGNAFSASKPRYGFIGLTLKGYQFVATIRNPTAWNRIKAEVSGKSSPITVDAMLRYGVPFAAAVFSADATVPPKRSR